jgi:hypothetical protein
VHRTLPAHVRAVVLNGRVGREYDREKEAVHADP